MSRDDWFRNSSWDARIANAFDERLKRSRRKESYLRIQASCLSRVRPEVALQLLDRYFELPDNFEHAQAHLARAEALLALGRPTDAVASLEAALAREAEYPKLQTQAYLDLPYLIARRRLEEHFTRALEVLDGFSSRLRFPVDHFRWNASKAIIHSERGDSVTAKLYAERALAAGGKTHSGFAHHPRVGLLSEDDEEVRVLMSRLHG